MPISNATAERMFSLVASVKTKARNLISLHTLDTFFAYGRTCINEVSIAVI
jgi:hypothetical protein